MNKYIVSIKDGTTVTVEADYIKIDKGIIIFHKCTGIIAVFNLDEIRYAFRMKLGLEELKPCLYT